MTQVRFDRAVEVCLGYLRRVGVEWSPHPTKDDVEREYTKIWRQVGARAIEQLVDLPLTNDPDCRATLDVLSVFATPAWYTDEDLHDLVVAHMANLSLEHGNSDGSCYAYALLGRVLGSNLGQYQAGFRFGKLALDLVEKRGLDRFRACVYNCFGHHIIPWTRHLHDGRVWNRLAFNAAKESGDLTFAAFSCCNMIANLLAGGDPLEEVQREAENGLEFTRKMRFDLVSDYITGQLRLIRTLRGLTPKFGSFNDAEFDESRFEQQLEGNPRLAQSGYRYWIRKLQARFYADDYVSAIAAASKAHLLLGRSESFFEVSEYPFYSALAHAAFYASAAADERARHLEALATHQKKLAVWKENCPENFESCAALVAAEIARIEDRELDAERLYEKAIQSAREHGFVQNEAIAHEVAARFYSGRGLETIAQAYLQNARHLYTRWGALGKVKHLELRYPGLREYPRLPGDSTLGSSLEQVDVLALAKASQTVSSELDLGKLIETLLVIAVENAGAQRGVLILLRGDESQIEAEAITGRDAVTVNFRQAFPTPAELPDSILRYVIRTQESIILDDASASNQFSADEYVQKKQARSVLCLPLVRQASLKGALYLENNLASHVFTPDRISVLRLLASQAAISLDHARVYTELARLNADLTQENSDRREAEEALRASEERWRKLFENSSVGIALIAPDGHFIAANLALQEMLGYTDEELQRLTALDVTHEENRATTAALIAESAKGRLVHRIEKRYVRKDGSVIWAEVNAVFVPPSGSRSGFFPTIILDITERKRAEVNLARLNRTLQTLYQCNQALVRATEEYELLQSVCRILVEVGGLRMAWVGYRELNEEKTVRPVAKAGYDEGYLERINITWADTEPGRGPTGTAIRTGATCWTRDNRTEPNLALWRAEDFRCGYASSISLPLLAHGEAFGALTLHAEEPDAFNESTIEQYTDLANNLAYGVTAIRTREESKRAEQALRESEQRLQDVVDNTTAVVFVKDLELRYILVNREYERRHHVQRDNIRGKTDFDIHPHDIAEAVRANDRRVIEAGQPIEFEETVPSADGERCLIVAKFLLRDPMGKPYAVCGVATDITDRKRAENEIRQLNESLEKRVAERTIELVRSEEKFRALFEGTSQAVILHDENRILEVNPSWLRLLGYSSLDDVVGKHPAELSAPIQPGGERAEVLARMHIANTLANGSERFDWMMSRRDGTELPMEVFLTRIQLGGRQLIQAVCNDITQRKQAEAELVRTLAREKELGQLRSKFVSMVSHEFRTPLGIIQSSAEILKDYLEQLEPSEREDHLQSICHNTRRMAGIMEEVLLIGSFDAGKMEFKPGALELKTFVRGLADEVLSATGRRCPIELSLSEVPDEIQADGRLLRHIFTNLLTNAVKYSDAGRAVRFEIRRVGTEIVCAICDQGIGIPEADREWLFNAFHRGHNVDDRPGTGLGLVIVKRCVDLHGGKIKVESKVGEGTAVTVRLPMSSKVSPPPSDSAGAYWL